MVLAEIGMTVIRHNQTKNALFGGLVIIMIDVFICIVQTPNDWNIAKKLSEW